MAIAVKLCSLVLQMKLNPLLLCSVDCSKCRVYTRLVGSMSRRFGRAELGKSKSLHLVCRWCEKGGLPVSEHKALCLPALPYARFCANPFALRDLTIFSFYSTSPLASRSGAIPSPYFDDRAPQLFDSSLRSLSLKATGASLYAVAERCDLLVCLPLGLRLSFVVHPCPSVEGRSPAQDLTILAVSFILYRSSTRIPWSHATGFQVESL